MSIAVSRLNFKQVVIESTDGETKVDVTNSIIFIDYFEDILSPCVTMEIHLFNSASIIIHLVDFKKFCIILIKWIIHMNKMNFNFIKFFHI